MDYYESGGKHYVEVWLIDPTWNQNRWKANEQELKAKIQRFVNKPAIITPYLHHPHEYEHVEENPLDPEGNVRKHQEIDERYRVGHVIKIKPLPNSAYAGIIELTHQAAIEAFQAGKIPQFVSPAVYNLNMTGPMGEFTSFEPLHIAFVDRPAYGFKARVIDQCHGEQDLCLRNLGVASTVMGMACVAKALDKLQHTFHSSLVKSSVSVASELSLKEDSATPTVKVTATDNTAGYPPTQATVSTEDTNNKESKAAVKKPETPKKEASKESTAGDNKDAHQQEKEKDSKKEDISKLMEEIKNSIKEQVSQAYKALEDERKQKEAEAEKRKLIESYVTIESTAGNIEEREKRIKALMHIPEEELKDFLEQHYKIAGKGRSNAAKASKVSDFNKGMQQNAAQNVGSAALLLDQDTNDRIDRVLSMSRFVPRARQGIVPTQQREAVV